MDETSQIQSYYKGKTIFITGGSGFMGKVLIEKLLYCCSDLKKIYMLIRSKRGISPDIRIAQILKLPIFSRITEEKPEVLKKLVPISGDVTLDNFGMTDKQRELLINETEIVIHAAATLRLEATLKMAVDFNLIGTKRMLDLCKNMKKLEVFMYVSTAFCYVDQPELYEKIYDSPADPQDVIKLFQWMDEKIIDSIAPKLIAPHPNTYTYTKRLAEIMVNSEYPRMPVVITRPTVVLPVMKEPVPGWVDNLNGPIGLTVASGKGVLRSVHCEANYCIQFIPVDFAINIMIAVAYKVATTRDKWKSIPIYNVTTSTVESITYGEIVNKGRKLINKYPFEGILWYPDGNLRSNKWVHNILHFFYHILVAYLIDFLLLIFCQKRFMIRIQQKISNGLKFLQYFITREWLFHNHNMLQLWDEMNSKDRELFPFNPKNVNIDEYIKTILLGARQYCMKEDPSTLPRSRVIIKIMYVIHKTMVYGFYCGILYLLYSHSYFFQTSIDHVADKIKMLL